MLKNLLEALNVRVIGTGDNILVLAHGFGTDQSAWQRILPHFTPYYRIILYDLVCAGTVNPDHFDFRRYTTLDAFVDDLLQILNSLGVVKCTYIGHSASAMIGILTSIRRPDLFTRLVLIGGSPRFLNDKDYHGGFEKGEIEKVLSAMEGNYEAWVNEFAPLAVGADVPAAVREFSRTLFNMRPDITLWVSRTVFDSDLRGVLGMVKAPCCIIQSAKDTSVPVSVAMYLKTHLGGRNTIEMLHTEGHLPHLSSPALLVQVLRRVLLSRMLLLKDTAETIREKGVCKKMGAFMERGLEPDESTMTAILGICTNLVMLDSGKQECEEVKAAEKIMVGFHLPAAPLTLVLLSNMFAAAGRWGGSWNIEGRYEGERDEEGTLPGCSWIKVDNKVQVYGMEKSKIRGCISTR
ncbi:hypothetical protein HHK36_002742 [Tetracentron sinense]|uniref:AB hydrolase-1 domain-containing protein n=1 Tax=Tetracentron sinense TaxID=13715 RepID=A0A834ZM16_TETSI|nr:hypothetical protein HHK36_002742 [Tetracentron sinense]